MGLFSQRKNRLHGGRRFRLPEKFPARAGYISGRRKTSPPARGTDFLGQKMGPRAGDDKISLRKVVRQGAVAIFPAPEERRAVEVAFPGKGRHVRAVEVTFPGREDTSARGRRHFLGVKILPPARGRISGATFSVPRADGELFRPPKIYPPRAR